MMLAGLFMTACSKEQEKVLVHAWPNAVVYEIFTRAFYDTNGDGIGDFRGIIEKLDYLAELGVEGIWLMPIHPSPSYHKYDVMDYYAVDPEYGSMEDFKKLVAEAHKRDIKIIIDLVVNHTSKQHPWFKAALADKNSPYRNWYIWADETTNTNELGEWGQKVWHSYGMDKYYGTFWEGMPDLNLDHPEVRAELIKIGKYWLEEIGVDGFRLDAAKHIYPDKEKEKNYAWWQEFRKEMEVVKPDVFLVGEVWAPASVVGPYLQDGLHSTFNFDLSEKIISSVKQEKDVGIVSNLVRVREYYKKMDERYVDSIFLTNHDMNRVMSQLDGNLEHAKVAASILFTLPGSPFIYYGEEIGMKGMKPDEYIREPFVWSNGEKEDGTTAWIAPRYSKPDQVPPLDEQINDENSLFQHYKKLIHVRRTSNILVQGEIQSARLTVSGIVSFKRVLDDQSLLVIHNLTGEEKEVVLEKDLNVYGEIFFNGDSSSKVKKQGDSIKVQLAPYSTIILDKK
jgi:alpha-amylase